MDSCSPLSRRQVYPCGSRGRNDLIENAMQDKNVLSIGFYIAAFIPAQRTGHSAAFSYREVIPPLGIVP